MEYKYTTTRVSFTEAMKTYCQEHFASLEKFLSENEPIKITLDKDGDNFVVKSQVVSKMNRRIQAEARGDEFYLVLIEVRDSLEKQLKRKKEKSYWKERITRPEINSEVIDMASIFVRNKVFVLDSISSEQAVDEMEDLGYTFYIFRNCDEDDEICVVYKRFEGNFGILHIK